MDVHWNGNCDSMLCRAKKKLARTEGCKTGRTMSTVTVRSVRPWYNIRGLFSRNLEASQLSDDAIVCKMVANRGATNMKNIEIVRSANVFWIVSSQSAKLQQFLQKDYKVSKAQTRGNKKKKKIKQSSGVCHEWSCETRRELSSEPQIPVVTLGVHTKLMKTSLRKNRRVLAFF